MHVADNDPSNSEHVAIGDGCIEWKEFLSTLHSSGYDGYLGLDLGCSDKLLDGYRQSVERLQAIAADLNIPMEV